MSSDLAQVHRTERVHALEAPRPGTEVAAIAGERQVVLERVRRRQVAGADGVAAATGTRRSAAACSTRNWRRCGQTRCRRDSDSGRPDTSAPAGNSRAYAGVIPFPHGRDASAAQRDQARAIGRLMRADIIPAKVRRRSSGHTARRGSVASSRDDPIRFVDQVERVNRIRLAVAFEKRIDHPIEKRRRAVAIEQGEAPLRVVEPQVIEEHEAEAHAASTGRCRARHPCPRRTPRRGRRCRRRRSSECRRGRR